MKNKIISLGFFKTKLFRFLVVGVNSTWIELLSLYLMVEFLHIPLFGAVILAFFLALVHSFFFNKIWTFQNNSEKYRRLFMKFLIVSGVGFLLTLVFMYVFTILFGIYYIISKILTTLIVVVWNFLGNKMWTFKQKPAKKLKFKSSLCYSIIVPAYNEESRIIKTLQKIEKYFIGKKKSFEILVVDDGSSDNTVRDVEGLQSIYVSVIQLPKNQGKGAAVKKGVLHSKGKYILFTDADNSTPIEEFAKLEGYIESHDIIIGSRFAKKSEIRKKQAWYRILIGRVGNFLIRNFLIDGIHDTQCGFKLFKRKAALDCFSKQKIKGFGFDMEILLIGNSKNYKIKEVGVIWNHSEMSRVRPIKDALKTLYELMYIKLNYWFEGYK